MEDNNAAFALILSVLMFSSFVKFATVLGILSHGLGLKSGFGIIVLVVSLVLSVFVIEPTLSPVGGINALFTGKGSSEAQISEMYKPFLKQHTDQQTKDLLTQITRKNSSDVSAQKQEQTDKLDRNSESFGLLAAAFVISELKEAFRIGLMLLIPFVMIDLLLVNILAALGVTQIDSQTIALPLKLLLFVAVGGWDILTQRLLSHYF